MNEKVRNLDVHLCTNTNVERICVWTRVEPLGVTPIHKLYGDVPLFRVWFLDRPFTGSQIQRFSKIFYKQGLKITHFDEKMSGAGPENHKQCINFT